MSTEVDQEANRQEEVAKAALLHVGLHALRTIQAGDPTLRPREDIDSYYRGVNTILFNLIGRVSDLPDPITSESVYEMLQHQADLAAVARQIIEEMWAEEDDQK